MFSTRLVRPRRSLMPTKGRTVNQSVTGIIFPSNGEAGSAMRISFTGSNRPSRTNKSVIWDAYYIQQTGYYAWLWDSENDNTWHDGDYESGAHPFPCSGTFDGTGASTGSDSGSSVHYYEIAGAGTAVDWIATPGGSAYLVTKGVWVKQAIVDELITVSTSNDTIQRTYYVDLSDTSKKIVRKQSSTLARNPATPQFSFGSSEWRDNQGGAGVTDEASSGRYRNAKIFNNAALSASDLVTESNGTTNAALTSAGISSLWYSNISWTPDDISDKSGAGHNPAWVNANHGTLWVA